MSEFRQFCKFRPFSTILALGIFVFMAGIVPLHLAAPASHANCHVCSLINHPPDLHAPVVAATILAEPSGQLNLILVLRHIAAPVPELRASRAPPTLS
jgi:hypothetical protein